MKFVRFIMKSAALASAPKHIEHFSKFSPSPLSMKQFLDFGEYRSASVGASGGTVLGRFLSANKCVINCGH